MAFLPAVAAVAGVVGSAVSAVGAIQSANAQASAASYQAQVAKNNQTTAYQNAEYAEQAGQAKAEDQSLKARAQLGAARTNAAASGLDVNSGSAADVQTTQAETGTLDTQRTIDQANLQAYGYRTQAASFGDQAQLDTMTAQDASASAPIAAAGSVLSGISSLGTNWAKMQNVGATD
jgi:hypothetical protein